MRSVNIISEERPRRLGRKWEGRLFLLLLATGIGMALAGCGNKAKDVPVDPKKPLVPEEGVNIESYLSEKGMVKGKLTAPYMLRYQQADTPYTEFPHSLHVDFYNDSLIVESRVDALYGKYLPNQEKVFLRDTVVVKNILKGDTLHCDELWWDQNTKRFYTDKPVRIHTKTQILFGKGMEADQNFRWYNITHMTGQILTGTNGVPK